jgi:deoxyribonuclease-1
MDESYPRYSMSKAQRQLMTAWDKQYPVTEWECQRALLVEDIQGNSNGVVRSRCQPLGW